MKNKIALIAAVMMMFTGCSERSAENNVVYPDAQQGNSFILESENGYYLFEENTVYIGYHDKATGKNIMLCSRPECSHKGEETCTATYRNLKCGSKAVLYNGDLYFTASYSDGETAELSLYRVKGDGSALDKVCVLHSAKAYGETDVQCMEFGLLIHRGYAYVSYELSTEAGGFNGFMGSGIARVDIRTGEVKKFCESDDFFSRRNASMTADQVFFACGDYVYYYDESLGTVRVDESGNTSVINNDKHSYIIGAEKDGLYFHKVFADEKRKVLHVCDPVTMEEKVQDLSIDYDEYPVFVYQGKIFTMNYEGNAMNIYQDGSAVQKVDLSSKSQKYWTAGFSISDGKIYCRYFDQTDKGLVYIASCPVDDFLAGNIVWKNEYDMKEYNAGYRELMAEIYDYGTDEFILGS